MDIIMTKSAPIPDLKQVEEYLYKPDNFRKLRTIIDLNLKPVDEHDEYLPWNQFKHLNPPKKLTVAEHWFGVKKARENASININFGSEIYQSLIFCMTNTMQGDLYFIDQNFKGNSNLNKIFSGSNTRNAYRAKYRIEEAIYCAYLEGYSVEKSIAENIIKGSFEASNKHEEMVLNIYQAQIYLGSKKDQTLIPEMIFELYDTLLGKPYNNAPVKNRILENLKYICDFINTKQKTFIHPIIKALALQFCILDSKPFNKMNGLVARLLCHWYLIKNGYWLVDFASISKALKSNQGKYTQSVKLSQEDNYDITYFLIPMVQMIKQSLEQIEKDINRSIKDISEVETLIYKSGRNIVLNHRQLLVLTHAVNNPNYTYTIQEYKKNV